jgi:chemotaxis protein MotB
MKPPAPHGRGGHDRWLMSYADLVTLLLALFTTLYAASSIDAQKLGPLTVSLNQAFDGPPVSAAAHDDRASIVPPVTVVAGDHPRSDLQLRLAADLADAITLDRIAMHRDARGLILSLPEEAAFPVASADVTPEARALINRIAAAVAPTNNGIRIEGHTDDVPISTSRYSSNWELSTARASAVVAYLVSATRLDPARLSAAGYGEFHPRVANDTAENRARNRRIDIVILDTPLPVAAGRPEGELPQPTRKSR